ncbi:MAG: hypothetical protein QM662_04350 [Gordonia sp. (in: high G+C Gram-positive bacteria)]
MGVLLIIFVLVAVVAAAALVRLGFALRRSSGAPPTADVRRSVQVIRVALVADVGAIIPVVAYLIGTDHLGRALLMVVPLALICLQLGLLGATIAIDRLPRVRVTVRVASLDRRRTAHVVPRALTIATTGAVAAAIAALLVTTRTACLDPGTGEMRSFGVDDASFTPYLGSYYTGPLLTALVLSVALTACIATGSRRWAALDHADADLALRLRVASRSMSVTAIIAGYVIALAAWVLGDAARHLRESSAPLGHWAVMTWLMPAMLVGGLALAGWSCLGFVAPARRPGWR